MEQLNILKISLIQFNIFWENPQKNREIVEKEIQKADSELVILPEMFSTGFTMSPEKTPDFRESLNWMISLAQEKNIGICGSLVTQEQEEYFNRFYFVYPSGEYRTYDKRHLFTMGDEPNHYSPGSERLILEYKGWKICPLVCYDLRFPVFSRNDCDYDLLIYVANWPAKRAEHWKTLLRARAIENQAYVIGCNRIGVDGYDVAYDGDSAIIDFRGDYIAEAGSKSLMLQASLDFSILKEGRDKFPVLGDRDSFSADWL